MRIKTHPVSTPCRSARRRRPGIEATHSFAHIPFFIGDTTSSSNDGLDTGPVVGGVLSLVIILISGVSGLVIILLILKIRSLTSTHQ